MNVKANIAQKLLIVLGVDPRVVMLGHTRGKSRSHTKRGRGRAHQQGTLGVTP